MPVPTDSFQYDYRLVDFVARMQQILEQRGVELDDVLRSYFTELTTATDVRDTDLEDYLGLGTFAPALGVSLGAPQTIAHNTLTPIVFTNADFQSTDVIEWDGVSTLTVQNDGIVSVVGNLRYAANAAAVGVRFGAAYQNVTEITGAMDPAAVNNVQSRLSMSDAVAVLAGDTFTLQAYHTQGGNLNVDLAKLRLVYLGQTG